MFFAEFYYRKVLFFLILISFCMLNSGFCEEEDFSASGFDNARIEKEEKLLVPVENAEEVWIFIKNNFVDNKQNLLKLDPEFTSYCNLEEFWDTYYDTPSFQLYKMKSGVRHRKRINLSNPDDPKSGRELMQIKINSSEENSLSRLEIKFPIEYPNNIKGSVYDFPMLSIIKPSSRNKFIKRITALNLDPSAMKPILTVHDLRKRIYILKNDESFLSISMDHVDSSVWNAKVKFIEIEPELNEIAFTDADNATRAYMEKILNEIVAYIQAEFPYIKSDLTPKYNKAFDGIKEQLPFFSLLIKADLNSPNSVIFVAMALFAGLILIIFFIIKKYFFKKTNKLN